MHQPYVGVRAEVLGAVADHGPGAEYPGERFIFDTDPGESFIVLKAYIIMRPVFLDEVVFEKEGILFGSNDDVFDIGYFSHQHLHFAADRIDLHEVGAYPFLQVLGLAHINDPVFLVKVLVYTGFVRQRPDDGFEMGEVFIEGAQFT